MNINSERPVMIFSREGQYGKMYSTSLSKKLQDGSYDNTYMNVRFKKGVDIEDKTNIYIKNAWLSFNKKDDKPLYYIFINEFAKVEKVIEQTKEQSTEKAPTNMFSDEVVISDDDLPF